MKKAICFNCGIEKTEALVICGSCQATPTSFQDASLSLALSTHISSPRQLQKHASEIQHEGEPTISETVILRAREALLDPQLKSMIMEQTQSIAETQSNQSKLNPASKMSKSKRRYSYKLTTTKLHESPFSILGATLRDNRQRIVQLSEIKSLEIGHDVSQDARSALTNTRTRLSLEMSWMPGVSPKRASEYLQILIDEPMEIRLKESIPTLAHLNLSSAALEAIDENHDSSDLIDFICQFANLVDSFDAESVMRDINEDRVVAGFPVIQSISKVEDEFTKIRRNYQRMIRDCVNQFDSSQVIQIMTNLLDHATHGGKSHAPSLIDDLVDGYETETEGVLELEAKKIYKLLEKAKSLASSDEASMDPVIDRISVKARDWDCIAQPIQLSAEARGTTHTASKKIAHDIRNLAIYLFNKHGMLEQAQRLSTLLQELFVELPEVSFQLNEDVKTLRDIQARKVMREQEIAYECDAQNGTLGISVSGILWNDFHYTLEEITFVRWGGITKSVYGISTGTKYILAFGNNTSESVVHFTNEKHFFEFINRLRKTVCRRIIIEILDELKSGNALEFGKALIHDDGVILEKHKLFWSEQVKCPWSEVRVRTENGAFHISSRYDRKTYCSLSYIEVNNVHLIEQILRVNLKGVTTRLSEIAK